SQSLLNDKLDGSDKTVPSVNSTTHAQPSSLSKVSEKPSASGDLTEGPASSKVTGETPSVNARGQPGSSKPSNSDCVAVSSASSGPGLSPSSSMGSLSSEKSTLNPHAKEFKLNPNAKSFTPSQTSVRPPSPVSDGSFYYQTPVSPVPHMHMPVNFGIGPSFPGHQPVVFNPQVAPMQSPQAYFHPTGPQYGQPMLLGQRQVMYYQPVHVDWVRFSDPDKNRLVSSFFLEKTSIGHAIQRTGLLTSSSLLTAFMEPCFCSKKNKKEVSSDCSMKWKQKP
ncbi:hypothetical protein Gohar_003474, partial [Gossypium harknessii]|nr:hypothetical protein [Gossypium harknessii]